MCQLLWFNKLYKLPYPSTFITYFCFAIYYPLINGSFQTKNVAASTGRAAPAWKWKTICLMTMVRNLVICCHIGFVAYLPGAGVFLLSRRLLWFIDISAKWTAAWFDWLSFVLSETAAVCSDSFIDTISEPTTFCIDWYFCWVNLPLLDLNDWVLG